MAVFEVAQSRDGERGVADETFGARLKRLREQAGLTQQQLADQAGMHRFGLAKLERGERHPSWATVQALAKALGSNTLAFEGTVESSAEEKKAPGKRGRPKKQPPAEPEPPAEEKPKKKKGK